MDDLNLQQNKPKREALDGAGKYCCHDRSPFMKLRGVRLLGVACLSYLIPGLKPRNWSPPLQDRLFILEQKRPADLLGF